MKHLTRRQWNSAFIILIVVFLGVIQLIYRQPLDRLLMSAEQEPESTEQAEQDAPLKSPYLDLIGDPVGVKSLTTNQFHLSIQEGDWASDVKLTVAPATLANRWLSLTGTAVNAEQVQQLMERAPMPATLTVKKEQADPVRLTYFDFGNFWLMQTCEGKWLAVSVATDYLFPFPVETTTEVSSDS